MTFPSQKQRVPAAIGTITITIATTASGPVGYSVQAIVLDANGGVISIVADDLLRLLTATQRTTLDNFMAALRAKAVAEILA